MGGIPLNNFGVRHFHIFGWTRKVWARARLLRWPFDAEDTLTFGGSIAIGVGAGHRWGWDIGLLIFGALMLSVVFIGLRQSGR